MKDDPVIESFVHVVQEVPGCEGSLGRIELKNDGAVGSLQGDPGFGFGPGIGSGGIGVLFGPGLGGRGRGRRGFFRPGRGRCRLGILSGLGIAVVTSAEGNGESESYGACSHDRFV